jgi:hypothetical protein
MPITLRLKRVKCGKEVSRLKNIIINHVGHDLALFGSEKDLQQIEQPSSTHLKYYF